MKLPTFNQAWHKQDSERNPLEDFIVGFQPSASNSPQWREDLQAAIDFVLAQKVGELNAPICICSFGNDGWRENLPYEVQCVGDRYVSKSFGSKFKIVTENDNEPCSFYQNLIQQTRRHRSDCPNSPKKANTSLVHAKKAPKKVVPKLDLSRHINVLDKYRFGGVYSRLAIINALREIQNAYNAQ